MQSTLRDKPVSSDPSRRQSLRIVNLPFADYAFEKPMVKIQR